MDIDITDIGGSVTCLRVYGALDGQDGGAAAAPWAIAPGAWPRDVAVDLSHVSTVSPAGLNWLLGMQEALRARGRSLVLFGAPVPVHETLHRAAIDRLIPLADDESTAVERLFA